MPWGLPVPATRAGRGAYLFSSYLSRGRFPPFSAESVFSSVSCLGGPLVLGMVNILRMWLEVPLIARGVLDCGRVLLYNN